MFPQFLANNSRIVPASQAVAPFTYINALKIDAAARIVVPG